MAQSRKSLKKLRALAFAIQSGRCYYCGQPMWNSDRDLCLLIDKHGISDRQARLLRCTGEHLVAHQDGGSSKQGNIVAACEFCNKQRHAKKVARSPSKHRTFVRKRLKQGAWHGLTLTC